jgi:hypothetical protein
MNRFLAAQIAAGAVFGWLTRKRADKHPAFSGEFPRLLWMMTAMFIPYLWLLIWGAAWYDRRKVARWRRDRGL